MSKAEIAHPITDIYPLQLKYTDQKGSTISAKEKIASTYLQCSELLPRELQNSYKEKGCSKSQHHPDKPMRQYRF